MALILWMMVWLTNIDMSVFHPRVITLVFTGTPLLVFWLRYFPRIMGCDFSRIDWKKKGVVLRVLKRYVQQSKGDKVRESGVVS